MQVIWATVAIQWFNQSLCIDCPTTGQPLPHRLGNHCQSYIQPLSLYWETIAHSGQPLPVFLQPPPTSGVSIIQRGTQWQSFVLPLPNGCPTTGQPLPFILAIVAQQTGQPFPVIWTTIIVHLGNHCQTPEHLCQWSGQPLP